MCAACTLINAAGASVCTACGHEFTGRERGARGGRPRSPIDPAVSALLEHDARMAGVRALGGAARPTPAAPLKAPPLVPTDKKERRVPIGGDADKHADLDRHGRRRDTHLDALDRARNEEAARRRAEVAAAADAAKPPKEDWTKLPRSSHKKKPKESPEKAAAAAASSAAAGGKKKEVKNSFATLQQAEEAARLLLDGYAPGAAERLSNTAPKAAAGSSGGGAFQISEPTFAAGADGDPEAAEGEEGEEGVAANGGGEEGEEGAAAAAQLVPLDDLD